MLPPPTTLGLSWIKGGPVLARPIAAIDEVAQVGRLDLGEAALNWP
jgi:hypothetical protein